MFRRLSLAQRFMLAGICVLTAGMLGMGWWVGEQIEDGVIHQTASTTALYVDSVVAPRIQELAQGPAITAEHATLLTELLKDTALGSEIVAFKIWAPDGRIAYSTEPAAIGQLFDVHGPLEQAWRGQVASEVSDLSDEENTFERGRWPHLLETYTPVRLIGTNRIIAVAEFYQTVDKLNAEIAAAKRRSWLVVGGTTLVMYLLLAGFAQRASDTIDRQQVVLEDQVRQLTALLAQNEALHQRVQGAAARTAALNERFLRRISAELHDGPAQALALALLRLDHIPLAHAVPGTADNNRTQPGPALEAEGAADLETIRTVLQHALREVRGISAGLALPQLADLTLEETVQRAVQAHERRTRTTVELDLRPLPPRAAPAVKIALYRVLQEALNNAYRHAGGAEQRVRVALDEAFLHIAVSDAGPGFDASGAGVMGTHDEHLGLVGMRERVESLGGRFDVHSAPGQGTTIAARLPLREPDAGEAETSASNHGSDGRRAFTGRRTERPDASAA